MYLKQSITPKYALPPAFPGLMNDTTTRQLKSETMAATLLLISAHWITKSRLPHLSQIHPLSPTPQLLFAKANVIRHILLQMTGLPTSILTPFFSMMPEGLLENTNPSMSYFQINTSMAPIAIKSNWLTAFEVLKTWCLPA